MIGEPKIVADREIPANVAAKYDVELSPEASRAIYEEVKAACCRNCFYRIVDD